MQNPFKYSHTVKGQAFCNRIDEQRNLLQFIQNSQNALIYSHRRTGKSSLIKKVFQNIKDQGLDIGMVYVDLYGTTSESDFVARTLKEMGSLKSNIEKLIKFLKENFTQIPFKLGVDPLNFTPTLVFDQRNGDNEFLLNNLMELLGRFSKDKRLVVVFDEFQEITNYVNHEVFEKRLRSFIQTHKNISYIFSGSQTHLLISMFQSNGRAFYQQAASLPLKRISTDDYLLWLTKIFSKSKNPISPEKLRNIIQKFDNHPMFIQFFCFNLWEELQRQPWNDSLVAEIESLMINNKKAEYQILWDNLTNNQKKVLKLIQLNGGQNLYTVTAMSSVEIKTPSVVTQCLKVLKDKEIIVKDDKKYIIQDLLLRKWIASQL